MRNRIARLITIGLTTVSMTLTALSGAAPITLTAQAAPNDPATQATPNGGDPVATRGIQKEREYDKGAEANGRPTAYYEEKYGSQGDKYPDKYKGAELKLPDYSSATDRGYTTDPDSSRYTFSIMQPEYYYAPLYTSGDNSGNPSNEYLIFSLDRNDENTIYATIMDKRTGNKVSGLSQNPIKITRNSGIPGTLDHEYKRGRDYYYNFTTSSINAHNAIGILNNRLTIRSMYDGIYVDGEFKAVQERFYERPNGAIRYFTLTSNYKGDYKTYNVATEAIPVKAKQTTRYVGIVDENDRTKDILLDTFIIEGYAGETYVAPSPNSYKGWIYDASMEPTTRTGSLGKEYTKDTPIFRDAPTGGIVREWKVLEDGKTVRARIYRDVTNSEYNYSQYYNDPYAKIRLDGYPNYVLRYEEVIPIGKDAEKPYRTREDKLYGSFAFPYTEPYTSWGYTGTFGFDKNIYIRNPIAENPVDITYYYRLAPEEPVSPETPDVKSKGAQTTIKKALELVNIAHKYIPSVPDVTFNYEVNYDLYGTVLYDDGALKAGENNNPVGYVIQGENGKEYLDKGVNTNINDNSDNSIYENKTVTDSFGNSIEVKDANGQPIRTLKKEALYSRYTPVGYGMDANDTEFEIWRGPIGGIKLTNAETDAKSHKGTVRFHHDDDAEKDTDGTGKSLAVPDGQDELITKKLQVEIVDDAFKAPGVYRYILLEKGGEERAMTEWDHEDEKGKKESKVLDDIEHNFDKEKNPNGEIRYLDIYVEWNTDESGLIVKDMVLHNISGKLNGHTHGDYTLGMIQNGKQTPAGTAKIDPDHKDEGKKDAFTKSTYTTYDLVIGKEIMGKGLTNYDITERVFTFKVTINAPSYTRIKGTRGAYDTSGLIDRAFRVPSNGVLDHKCTNLDGSKTFEVKVKQGEWVLLSGIPSGSTYEVEEVDDWSDPNSANSALFENYYSKNMKEMIEDPNNLSISALASQNNNGSMLEDQPRRNTYMMTLQNRLDAVANGKEFVNSTQEELVDVLVNVSGEKTKTTGPITLRKYVHEDTENKVRKTDKDSIDSVFFLNLRRDNVVTGVAMSVAPYALMVVAAVIGVGGFLIVKKRRDADLDED